MPSEKQSTKNAKRKTQKIRQEKINKMYRAALQKATDNENMNKMINSNPRGNRRSKSDRYTASKGGTPAMRLNNGGPTRTGYKAGGQPEYKSGEMHKCMPN